jgi:hypothetical protein
MRSMRKYYIRKENATIATPKPETRMISQLITTPCLVRRVVIVMPPNRHGPFKNLHDNFENAYHWEAGKRLLPPKQV